MKTHALIFTLALSSLFFAACGEQGTTENVTNINQIGMEVVSSVKDLPKCTKDNEGEQALVKGESSIRVCVDGKWFATKESAKDTVFVAGDTVYLDNGNYSCTTKELKDKSGLKIICNGDSIGVVLNGVNGKDGEKGDVGKEGKNGAGCTLAAQTDSSVTIKCGDSTMTLNFRGGADTTSSDTLELDSEKVAISLDSLSGYSQKGPFLKGSSVLLYELSDGRTLKQMGNSFSSVITSNDGRYKFSSRNLVSQYALIEVEGKYRNEVTGNNTSSAIKLQAYTNMLMRRSANVNLLTHLEKDRVYHLVTKENKTVRAAKKQAQAEIFEAFHIDASKFKTESEDLDVFGKTDADAALLAISVLLQGDGDETDLSVLLTEMADDLAEDGAWDNPAKRTELADWAITADSALNVTRSKFVEIRKHVSDWKLSDSVPHFEWFARPFYGTELGLGVCGKDVPMETVKHVSNRNSMYYAESYVDTARNVRFKCSFQGGSPNARWVMAKDIEKDTMGWGKDFSTGNVRNGQVNQYITYVFENGYWRQGTDLDSIFEKHYGGSACIKDDTTSFRYNKKFYECRKQLYGGISRKWVPIESEKYNDTQDSLVECQKGKNGRYGYGAILKGYLKSTNKYVCDADTFRLVTPTELEWNRGCVSYIHGTSVMFDGQYSYYKCTEDGWKFDVEKNSGTIKDDAGTEYRTIMIENQVWMAENLNYEVEGQSYCYNDSLDSCAKYGRLYTWAAAVGKTEEECGYGKDCELTEPVRGVCPEGWHLPSGSEWKTLDSAVGSIPYAMQAKGFVNWSGATDTYGLSVFPAGGYCDGSYSNVGSGAIFWSSTEHIYSGASAYYWYVMTDRSGLNYNYCKVNAYSVRCVKDAP
ncbi:fibrobacter succinogenes major paralogous domain-containing protein [uncultured Fibrobacter sp.]|uniref:fibrobacter succinogenes major paralogous domain-containing protein n=1 Tax=uncultured Fibrobacter sp. TaxID=261512 RepID=UPI002636C196|nr:fibrobacter succinogenes major paralogous domain-containing protein [uncultured Fibrobacter sp.]